MRETCRIRRRLTPACTTLAAITLVCSLSLESCSRRGRELPAKARLEKSSTALGENKLWTTRVEKGLHIAWNTPGWGTLKSEYSRFIKKPDKLMIDQDNSAYDHPFFRMYYYNGGDAWYMVNLTTGRSPQVTANMKTLLERVDGIAYYLAACDTIFSVPTVPTDSLRSGASLERIGCVLKGDTTLFDLDKKTHLLSRRVENRGKRVYLFDDYQKRQGRKVPFHVTVYDDGAKSNEFIWREVLFNETLNDSIFAGNRPPQEEVPPK